MKRIVALVLVPGLCLGLSACGRKKPVLQNGSDAFDPYESYEDYNDRCQAIYDDVLGDFFIAYEAAKTAENVSERYALMAIAEAKLLETAVLLPLNSGGGSFGISRLVPYTVPSVLWGNDNMRFQGALVTTAPISAAHREQMKVKLY